MTEKFEPKIVGLLCTWCSYTGADLAGTSRMKYQPNLIPIRLMCSGRVDPVFIFKAFAEGADGVMLAGWHPGDCHYQEGNYKTMRRVPLLKKVLAELGINPDRVIFEFISASEGARYAATVDEFTDHIRKLGPLQLQKPELEAVGHHDEEGH